MLGSRNRFWRRLAAVAVLTSSGTRRGARGFTSFSSVGASSSRKMQQSNENTEATTTTCIAEEDSSPQVTIHHFLADQPIGSTQDEARRLLRELKPSVDGPYLAAIADVQTNGRGTNGRKWEAGRPGEAQVGNLYLTVCIPFEKLPVMPTLLPLQIAVLVAEQATQALDTCRGSSGDTSKTSEMNGKQGVFEATSGLGEAKVTVKWPNDVLINDQKLAGTLIESEIVDSSTWLLVGIGTNILFAPSLDGSPGKHTRLATCIHDHCAKATTVEESGAMAAYEFGVDLAQRLADWILQSNGSEGASVTTEKASRETQVLQQWKSFAEFGKIYELRGTIAEENAGSHQGEEVVTLGIQADGQLLVRGQDGRNRLLVADYMF